MQNYSTLVTPTVQLDAVGHQCATDLELAYNIGAPPMLKLCNEQSLISLTLLEPTFLLFYAYIMLQMVVLLLYKLYRNMKVSNHKAHEYSLFEEGVSMPLSKISNGKSDKQSNLSFSGYKKDAFGFLV
jgi:hypothetical protein